MSRLALIHPSNLIGDELRESLEQRRPLWRELRLFSTLADEVGTLSEVRGEATFIQPLEEGGLNDIDVAFFCGPVAQNRDALAELPPGATGIILSPDASPEDGQPIVAQVNPHAIDIQRPILSPHPGVIGLSHLLHPLKPFKPRNASATLLQPISVYGSEGLDEMLSQTRSLLAFGPRPEGILPTQLAFNALPVEEDPAHLPALINQVLETESAFGREIAISTQVLQVGIFHSYTFSLFVQLEEDPGPEEIHQALGDQIGNAQSVDPELLGPIDAAGNNEVLIGPVRSAPGQPGGYWIYAVMDNLTCGGALNALQILEASRQGVTH